MRARSRARAVRRRSRSERRIAAAPAARQPRRRTRPPPTPLSRGRRITRGGPWVRKVREFGQELLVVLERIGWCSRLHRQRVERRLILERLDVVLLPAELGVHIEKNRQEAGCHLI